MHLEFPRNEFDACRKLAESDNRKRMDVWIVSHRAGSAGTNNLSLVKGKKTHMIVLQNGSIYTAPSGRYRTGFWEGGMQHFASISMYIDGKPSDALFRKYVRKLHCTYRDYGDAERLDFIQYDASPLCLAVRSGGLHEVTFKIQPSHYKMWPDEEAATGYTFISEGESHIIQSSFASTRYIARGEAARVEYDGRLLTVTFPNCREATLIVCPGSSGETDLDFERHIGFHEKAAETCVLTTPDFAFNKAFLWAKHDILEFYSESEFGNGFYAGFPEFSWFFGRDGEWMSLAAAECGLASLASEHLKTLYLASRNGRIPHELPLTDKNRSNAIYRVGKNDVPTMYMSIDSTPLWIISQVNLSRWTGVPPPVEEISQAVEFCRSCDTDGDGLIENRFSDGLIGWPESWADRRDGACIDINSWWLESLREYSALTGNGKELLEKCKLNFDRKFFRDNGDGFSVVDSVHEGKPRFIKSAMEIVPAIYAQGPRYSELVRMMGGEDMVVGWGLRSMSSTDPMYDRGYHTGQVWPLMTGWFVLAAYNNDMPEHGFRELSTFPMLSFYSPDPGRINEVYSSECITPTGQFAQGWSSSLYVQCIIEGLFGLKPDGRPGKEGLSGCRPSLPKGWKAMALRNVEYHGDHFDIKVTQDGVKISKRK